MLPKPRGWSATWWSSRRNRSSTSTAVSLNLGAKPTLGASEAAAVNARLTQLDSLLSSGQLEQSQELIADVAADARKMVAEQRRAAGLATGLQSNALGVTSSRLAEFAAVQQSFENLRNGENLLVGATSKTLAK